VFRLREHLPPFAYVPIADLVDEALEILRGHDPERPLFLYLQPIDPHGPYQPPLRYVQTAGRTFGPEDYVSYWELEDGRTVTPSQRAAIVALYDGEITYTDAELGRLFTALRELDLYDPTLIIVTADHGEQFQEHDLWRHSNSLYQQLVHVPLLVKLPGQREGRVVTESVAAIDVVPTILALLDADRGDCEGRSLVDAETGAESDAREDGSRPLFTYEMEAAEVVPAMKGVLVDGWKLVLTTEDGKTVEELYHVAADPQDTRDLRESHPEVASRLRGLLDDYEAAAGPVRAAETLELAPAELERLRALGYVE
jgi:arylsulfatase A-like enzyme